MTILTLERSKKMCHKEKGYATIIMGLKFYLALL